MDMRISTGLNPIPSTPRQSATARLDRWRQGAAAAPAAAPEGPAAPPAARATQTPQEFPFVPGLNGRFQESDPAAALARAKRAADHPPPPDIPFRKPSEVPDDAAAKAISRSMQEALQRAERKAEEQESDRRQQELEAELEAQARRLLIEQQQEALRSRVKRLGSLLEMVVGRYAVAPSPAQSQRLDTRQ